MIDRKHRQMGTQVEINPWNEIQCCVPVHSKMHSALKSPAVVVAALNMSARLICYATKTGGDSSSLTLTQ